MLARTPEHRAAIANGFDHRTAYVLIRAYRAKQHPGNRCADHTTVILPHQSQLCELRVGRFSGTRAQETIYKCRVERVAPGSSDNRFVRPKQARTPSLLKQAVQCFRRKLPPGTALSGKVSPGTLVYQRTLFDLDDQHERTIRQSQPLGDKRQWGTDAIRTNLADKGFQRIHLLPVHRPHLTGVRHTEDQCATNGVAKSSQLVGDGVPIRRTDAVAGEYGFFELDAAILAKFELLQHALAIPGHDHFLFSLKLRLHLADPLTHPAQTAADNSRPWEPLSLRPLRPVPHTQLTPSRCNSRHSKSRKCADNSARPLLP